jgi:hypothetical protein
MKFYSMLKSTGNRGKYIGTSEKFDFFCWESVIFVTTFILNTLTEGQQNSHENSNSNLIFELKVNLIEFCETDSKPWLHLWLGYDYMKQIIGMIASWFRLLWWPGCHLLLQTGWSVAVLLLLLELLVVAPRLRKLARLSHGWVVNHVVLWGSTTRTTSGGS